MEPYFLSVLSRTTIFDIFSIFFETFVVVFPRAFFFFGATIETWLENDSLRNRWSTCRGSNEFVHDISLSLHYWLWWTCGESNPRFPAWRAGELFPLFDRSIKRYVGAHCGIQTRDLPAENRTSSVTRRRGRRDLFNERKLLLDFSCPQSFFSSQEPFSFRKTPLVCLRSWHNDKRELF